LDENFAAGRDPAGYRVEFLNIRFNSPKIILLEFSAANWPHAMLDAVLVGELPRARTTYPIEFAKCLGIFEGHAILGS
jgi:hypothetical protein